MKNKIETITLENGLTIYFYLDKRKHTTFVNLVTKFGSSDKDFIMDKKEYHLCDGIAHLLEHYVVEANSIGDFTEILGEMQMTTNASTGLKKTSYYFQTVENLDHGLETLLKSCYSPIFSQERLEEIKKPIYQEIRMVNDNKFARMNRQELDCIFQEISFRDTAGTIEEVESITIDQLKTCYQAFYQPSNQFLIIAGNFDKETVLETIKKCYQEITVEHHEVTKIEKKEPLSVKRKRNRIKLPTAQNYCEIVYKIDMSSFSKKERLKLDFYLSYFFRMAFGPTSNIYQELTKEKIITYGINCDQVTIEQFLIINIGSYTDQDELFEKKITQVIKEKKFFDEEIFDLSCKQTLANIATRPESIQSVILPFVSNITDFDYPFPDTIEDVLAYHFDDFKNLINRLDFSHNHVSVMTQESE